MGGRTRGIFIIKMIAGIKKLEENLILAEIYFNNQLQLLRHICDKAVLKKRSSQVKILLASSCTTGTALAILGKNYRDFYTETVMLSRSFLEKITNFCYLQICPEEDFNRFLLHPWYRQYHNLNRSKSTANKTLKINFSGIDSFKEIPQVRDALEKFSDQNGNKNWSKKSIDEKVRFIADNTNIDIGFFLLNTISIYSNASESLHGSLFGCSYHTGIYDPSIDHKDAVGVLSNILKNLILLYAQMGSLVHIAIQMLHNENKKIIDFLETSFKNQKDSINFMSAIFDRKQNKNGS